jgi:CHAT domain-containing protein
VSNYIGSGWPVNDEQAKKLARTFYEGLLTGKPICDALQAGRAEISAYGDLGCVPTLWQSERHRAQSR